MLMSRWLNRLASNVLGSRKWTRLAVPRRFSAAHTRSQAAAKRSGDGANLNVVECLEDRSLLAVTWSNVGPSVIYGGQVQGLGDNKVAGAVQAIAPDPSNADIIYIGTVNGGIWKTSNATSASLNWTPLTEDKPSLSIGDLAISPMDSNTIYADKGAFSSAGGDGGPGVGVYKSTDAGATWSTLVLVSSDS